MWRKVILIALVVVFAFGVLFASILRTASLKYEFSGKTNPLPVLGDFDTLVDYQLPYPGKVLPDSRLWPLKALRDKLWLIITTSPSREAELKLLFADKRVGGALILFEKGKAGIGMTTLSKAEKYLGEASLLEKENRAKGLDTSEFLARLARASMKHYQIIERITEIAPDEARPIVIGIGEYSKNTFEEARNALLEKGIEPPENPFGW